MAKPGDPVISSATTVWKFPLRWGEVSVLMPKHARIIHVALGQDGKYPTLWAIVSPDAETETRSFAVVGTGQPLPKHCIHAGTLIDGEFVWHVFETTPDRVLMSVLSEAFGGF